MGFFSDLKSDLSHAVNEFKPESKITDEEAAILKEEEAMIEAEALKLMEEEKSLSSDIAAPDDDLTDILNMFDEDMKKSEKETETPVPTKYAKFDNYVMPSYEVEEEVVAPEPETVPEPEPVKETVAEPEIPAYEPEPVREPEPVAMPKTDYYQPYSAPTPAVPVRVAQDEVSVIMESMIINGNMATEGSLEIRGSVVGNVEALGKMNITGNVQGNSSAAEIYADGAKITGDVKSMGSIKVGQSTTIIGNVYATSAVIAGAVKGDIDVKGPVILDSTAIVLGNIKSKAVQINNGAVIEGMCSQCYAEVNPTSFFEELKKMK